MSQALEHPVEFAAGGVTLQGDLRLPATPGGIVLFAHGSGSSRHSARNRSVASELNRAGLATLLIDLLTTGEEEVDERTAHLRFDIRLLAERLAAAASWIARQPETRLLGLGLFGASTGAAAALVMAAAQPDAVAAIVSRGGRPDLAGPALTRVHAPTLLIVGGADPTVLELNRGALARLECERALVVVPGATHLFPEPGALERVAAEAREWFGPRLARPNRRTNQPR